MIMDKLYRRVSERGVVCLGLDTDLGYIPEKFKDKYGDIDTSIFEFNKAIINQCAEYVACFKVQIAYYESYGIKGLLAYKNTLEYLRNMDAIVIADIKRGDIAKTAEMYAKAHFTGDFEADIITLNPYMGIDTLEPYRQYFQEGKGAFVLVRTSNKGASDIEYLKEESGKRIYDIVGKKVQKFGEDFIGNSGYSNVGAVIGCTNNNEAIIVRKSLDKTFLLIPGYGAQGGGAEETKVYLKDNNGGVVNSSRGILLNYKNFEDGKENFAKYAKKEVLNMVESFK